MKISFDLHSHSGYAGGAGVGSANKTHRIFKRFLEASVFSPLKGINLLGTGDCQFLPWNDFLRKWLTNTGDGLFQFEISEEEIKSYLKSFGIDLEWDNYTQPSYILQTEVIFTAKIDGKRGRKKSHALILFPSFDTVDMFVDLLNTWEVNHKKMARPFIVCESKEEVSSRVEQIYNIDSRIEIIPAHVMTPEGVYGGNNGVNFLYDFFGQSQEMINAIETGLSADPAVLEMIPELRKRTFISNADAHSSGLNKVGREFTTLFLSKMTYDSIIAAIRNNNIELTGEFHPAEGRYFLSGHRENRKSPYLHSKGQFCYFSPKFTPKENKCPICGKELTKGVLNRAYEIAIAQGENRNFKEIRPTRDFVTMVPLIEIIAYHLGIKSMTSKRALNLYFEVISQIHTEVDLWTSKRDKITELSLPDQLKSLILEVRDGNFSFDPPGYDGTYGQLKIGKKVNFENLEVVNY